MKKFLKKYKVDIILILTLLTISLSSFLALKFSGSMTDNIAYIYVGDNIQHEIDLSKENNEIRYMIVDGKHGEVKIAIRKNDIRIVESTCPNKDCIHQGSATSLKPVICIYNEVRIELQGKKDVDVELG